MRKLQQYYIYKISTNHLKRKNYNINMTINEARKGGEIVSIGDSQMLRSLRQIKGIDSDTNSICKLLIDRKRFRKKKFSEENSVQLLEIEKEIDNILFVPEIVSILVEDIKHYEYIGKNGFIINDIKYKRLLCGAGQSRRNNSLWISENYEKQLKEILNNGRKDIEITPAKFSAYFALASSAGLKVSEPYFCVVKDLEVVRNEKVDFIEEIEKADDLVEERNVDISFNLWDGQGIISPRKAKEWAEELELDYVPSTFIIRSNFIKGMLAVVDFHKFSEEIENHFIEDVWGNKINIRDMDIILTQSQFKLWNAYDSISDYIDKFRKNKLSWSIIRISPKQEDKYCFLNYQFVQALNLDNDQMKLLCQQTINYFKNITKNKIEYSLLYLLGKVSDNYDPDIFNKLHDNVSKALILNNELIEDPYIKNTLVHSLNKKIKESYIGNLIVDGQYTMMVADPYAFMQYIFDLPIEGLLKRNEHYNKYWLDKNKTKIASMRAPLTWRSEVAILNLKNNDKINDWYQYLGSCVIYNIFGVDGLLAGGSDFDGDIVCLTGNQQVIDGAYGGLPIHYNSKKAPKVKIQEDELWRSDIKGFNCKVGFVTNCATTASANLPLFEEDSLEYIEIIKRLKRFRKEQGSTIDANKGLIIKPFPVHWTKWKNVAKCKTQEEIDSANFANKIVINKRPLFMRHVYSSYNKKYLDFNKRFNTDSKMRFDKSLECILNEYNSGRDFNDDEKKFIDDYYKFNPFIQTNCLMNNLCRYMENSVRELKENLKSTITERNIQLIKNPDKPTDKEFLKQLYDLYRRYKNEKRNFISIRDDGNGKHKTIEQFNKYIRQEAYKISSDGSFLANLAIDICYIVHPNDNKGFAWNIFGNEIVENILLHKQPECKVPFIDQDGDIEYLGEKYSFFDINIKKEEEYIESI